MYHRAGVPVCLTTDDEGVSRSNITVEHVKAVERYDFDYKTLKGFARNCLEYSFLPGTSLFTERDYDAPRTDFIDVRRGVWSPTAAQSALMATQTKLARQVLLERAVSRLKRVLIAGFKEN